LKRIIVELRGFSVTSKLLTLVKNSVFSDQLSK